MRERVGGGQMNPCKYSSWNPGTIAQWVATLISTVLTFATELDQGG